MTARRRPSFALALSAIGLVGALISCSPAPDVDHPGRVSAALGGGICPTGIFGGVTPANPSENDPAAVELGVHFAVRGGASVVGVRFYKGAGNTGPHVGHLWTVAGGSQTQGQLLATATFTNETDSGWQEARFPSPISPTAGVVLIASYFAPNGHYAADVGPNGGLAEGAGSADGPVYAIPYGSSYRYGGGYPGDQYLDSNYYVEPIVDDQTAPSIPTALAATATTTSSITLGWNASADGTGELLTNAARQHVYRDGALVATVGGTATSFVDTALPAGSAHTYTVQGEDFCGNRSAMSTPLTASTLPAAAAATIFDPTAPTGNAATFDTSAVELGVKFQSSVAGYVKAVRFYRAVAIPSGYVVHLWRADGTVLASQNVIEGQGPTPGWQEVGFVRSVPIDANTTYVASYYASQGGYSYEHGGLTTAVVNANLTALASAASGGNGVFRYGLDGGFPTDTYKDSNYFVDIRFSATP